VGEKARLGHSKGDANNGPKVTVGGGTTMNSGKKFNNQTSSDQPGGHRTLSVGEEFKPCKGEGLTARIET